VPNPDRFLRLFFSGSQAGHAAGMAYFQRISARSADRDAPTDLATRDAQLEAITRWGSPTRHSWLGSVRSRSRCWWPAGTMT
jgi:hypothetical protein